MPRNTLPSQPSPVVGAAYYWADNCDVVKCDTSGYISCIEIKRSEGTALDAAKRWQEKENKAVEKEAKRVAKLG